VRLLWAGTATFLGTRVNGRDAPENGYQDPARLTGQVDSYRTSRLKNTSWAPSRGRSRAKRPRSRHQPARSRPLAGNSILPPHSRLDGHDLFDEDLHLFQLLITSVLTNGKVRVRHKPEAPDVAAELPLSAESGPANSKPPKTSSTFGRHRERPSRYPQCLGERLHSAALPAGRFARPEVPSPRRLERRRRARGQCRAR
jgi:hypothetical protein